MESKSSLYDDFLIYYFNLRWNLRMAKFHLHKDSVNNNFFFLAKFRNEASHFPMSFAISEQSQKHKPSRAEKQWAHIFNDKQKER